MPWAEAFPDNYPAARVSEAANGCWRDLQGDRRRNGLGENINGFSISIDWKSGNHGCEVHQGTMYDAYIQSFLVSHHFQVSLLSERKWRFWIPPILFM